jgi:hypothetical protein
VSSALLALRPHAAASLAALLLLDAKLACIPLNLQQQHDAMNA